MDRTSLKEGHTEVMRVRELANPFEGAMHEEDPFILEGLIQSFVVHEWVDTMLE
jgi:hypothetical protein